MTGAPVELDRDEARELARRELADPSYEVERPLLTQLVERVLDWLAGLVDRAAGALGGPLGLLLLAAFVALIVAVVLLRAGPLARRATHRDDGMFGAERLSATDHRGAAERAAREGDWDTAVVERYRAVVATLEERSILDPRPGRTADEAAREAGSALPGVAEALLAGAHTFDGVRYGGRSAGREDEARLRDLDAAVRRARPSHPAEAA